ncbi:MAG TPA: serine/threonine-protein kinase [Chthonomonadaceae bacterium]|nr:serine/threonine-protein kinase [Chthonomonadaceae bacterium]
MTTGQLPEGTLLNGRYRILRAIGRGGMGTVYQASHERLDAILAVKEIHSQPATGTAQQTSLEQYEQEARFLVRLNHPNLPKVTDAFIDNDRFYLVMEFIEGVTLETRLKEAGGLPLDVNSVLEWGLQIADVLAYLHSQDPPIIFRDLKPSNVMVQPDGQIRLIDFGIARRFQQGAIKDTALLGSVGYSPPEQFGRHQTDARSDIYAFGATLHHLLTGRDPAATPFKFVAAHVLNPAVPEALSRLLAKCLAMEAENRPQSIHDVAMGLVSVRDELAARAQNPHRSATAEPGPRIISSKLNEANRGRSGRVPSRNLAPPPTPTPANPLRFVVLVLLALLVMGGTAFAWIAISRPHQTAPRPAPQPTPPTPQSAPPTSNTGNNPNPSQDPGNTASGQVSSPGSPAASGNQITPTPNTSTPIATCNLEPSLTQDGQTLRLRVSGVITGKKGETCRVLALFFDGTQPLMAQTVPGPHAMENGLLFGEYLIECPEDSHSFDGLIEIPRSEIATPTTGLFLQYVVMSKDQNLMEPQRLSLSNLIPAQITTQPPATGGPSGGSLFLPGGR